MKLENKMLKQVYGEKVDKFVRYQVRVSLGNLKGCNPVDISENDVNKAIDQMKVGSFKIHLNKITSYVNNVKKESIVFAFIDEITGYHYHDTVIPL